MSFEQEIQDIQAAVNNGAISASQGVAMAQRARKKMADGGRVPEPGSAPYGAAAGGGLGALAALLSKKHPFLAGGAGAAAGAGAGMALDGGVPGVRPNSNADMNDFLAGSTMGAFGGAGAMGLAKKFAPKLPGPAAGALGATAGMLGGLGLSSDQNPDPSGLGGDILQLLGTGAGGAGGAGLGALASKGGSPKQRLAGMGLGALLGAAGGDAGVAAMTGGERNFTPEVMGMSGGGLGGAMLGGPIGGMAGAALGGLAGKFGGDMATVPAIAGGLAASNPKIAGMAAKFGSKAKEKMADPFNSKGAEGATYKKFQEAMKAEFQGSPGSMASAFEGIKGQAVKHPVAASKWAKLHAADPEYFEFMDPKQKAAWFKKIVDGDEELLSALRGKYGVDI